MKPEYAEQMQSKGFAVIPADHMEPLLELRRQIFEKAKRIFGEAGSDPDTFFNNFHSLNVTGAKLNELRVKLIQECTTEVASGVKIFESFRQTLLSILGPDLLVQRNTNLVIQQPQDPNPSEVHRDSPVNSPFEVVVWLPLVDAYGTKAMYVLDREETSKALAMLDERGGNWDQFEQHCAKVGQPVPVKFGTALFFWPGLLHGSHINAEHETRWTLNMRYKNLFSPNGRKEPFEFFRVLCLSPIAKLGLDFQQKECLG